MQASFFSTQIKFLLDSQYAPILQSKAVDALAIKAKKEGKFSDIDFKQAKNDAFNAIRTEKSVAEEQKQEEEPKQDPAEEVVAEDKKIKDKLDNLVFHIIAVR